MARLNLKLNYGIVTARVFKLLSSPTSCFRYFRTHTLYNVQTSTWLIFVDDIGTLPAAESIAMIEFIYKTLTDFGYHHPLHPTLTHLPIGMVMGAFLFLMLALIFKVTNLAQTARNCTVLALVAALPTALLGIMDWLHFYGGSMLFPIKMKLFLAAVLIVLLVLAVMFAFKDEPGSKIVVSLSTLCLLAVIGLGYFGGELVYGTKASTEEVSEGPAAKGAVVFQNNCSACHFTDSAATKVGPGLKGIFKQAKFPLSGQQATEENFRKQLKSPLDKMPPFGHLTEEEVVALIAYLKTL